MFGELQARPGHYSLPLIYYTYPITFSLNFPRIWSTMTIDIYARVMTRTVIGPSLSPGVSST